MMFSLMLRRDSDDNAVLHSIVSSAFTVYIKHWGKTNTEDYAKVSGNRTHPPHTHTQKKERKKYKWKNMYW